MRGRFRIPTKLLDSEPEMVRRVLGSVNVYAALSFPKGDGVEYYAECEKFTQPIPPPPEPIPEYNFSASRIGEDYIITWTPASK